MIVEIYMDNQKEKMTVHTCAEMEGSKAAQCPTFNIEHYALVCWTGKNLRVKSLIH